MFDKLLYIIPLIFFAVQLVLLFIVKEEIGIDFVIGILVLPFATAFFFLNISMNSFILFIILSFILVLFTTFAFAKEKNKLGIVLTIVNVILVLLEYGFLFQVF